MTNPALSQTSSLMTLADQLVAGHRMINADFVEVLLRIESESEHLRHGYHSIFALCVDRWRFAEPAAARRVRALKAARLNRSVIPMLKAGELSLESIYLLFPLLTAENSQRILEAARGKRIREVEALIAKEAPRPDTLDLIRAVPTAPILSDSLKCSADQRTVVPGTEAAILRAAPREKTLQIAEHRVHFSFTGSVVLRHKIERLRDLLRHKFPEGRLEQIVEEAVDRRLASIDPDLWATPRKPTRAAEPSRRISRAIKRAVWQRDEAKCAFVGVDGNRCSARGWLEYDHIVPVAIGGPTTVENLRLLCRRHNQWRGKRVLPY